MRTRLFAAFLILMLLSGYLQFKYDQKTNYEEEKNVFVTLPPGKTVKIMSFGYQDVMADLLFIWSIQFYSAYHYNNRYDYLEHVYNTITDISPRYLEPYIVGSWIMALEAKDYEMAIRLLQKGATNMPEQWIFDYECAYYISKYMKDWERAEYYYSRAARNPKAPPHVKRKEAHMVYMKDDLNRAWAMWMEIYKHAESQLQKDSGFKHLFQIKFEMDSKALIPAIKRFRERYGRYPVNLHMLVRAGLIKAVPLDFSGNPYNYDNRTGKLSARKMFKWKK